MTQAPTTTGGDRTPARTVPRTGVPSTLDGEITNPGSLLSDPGTVVEDGYMRSGVWVILSRIISQIAQFLMILAAARFMQPADFGVFALISAVSVGLTRVSEAGWRELVMSSVEDRTSAYANSLALLCGLATSGLGSLVAGVLFLKGYSFAAAVTMELLAVWVLLTTLCATQAGILVKRGKLQPLAKMQVFGEGAGLVVGIAVLASGGGILGLGAAKLMSQSVILVGSIAVSRWFALGWIGGAQGAEAYRFSLKILATRLIAYGQDNVALFTIGALVGPAAAGLFRAASRLSGALSEVVSEPVRQLSWSAAQQSFPGATVDRLLTVTIIASTPLFVGLAATANEVVLLLLGPTWSLAGPLVAILALAGWLSVLNVATEPLLATRGQINLLPKLSVGFTGLTLLSLVVLAPLGVFWIAVGQFAVSAAILPVIVWVQQRYGGTSGTAIASASYPALIGAGLLAAAVLIVGAFAAGLPLPARFGLQALAGAAAYISTILALVPLDRFQLRMQPRRT